MLWCSCAQCSPTAVSGFPRLRWSFILVASVLPVSPMYVRGHSGTPPGIPDHISERQVRHFGLKKVDWCIRKIATIKKSRLWKVTNIIIQHDRVQQQFSSCDVLFIHFPCLDNVPMARLCRGLVNLKSSVVLHNLVARLKLYYCCDIFNYFVWATLNRVTWNHGRVTPWEHHNCVCNVTVITEWLLTFPVLTVPNKGGIHCACVTLNCTRVV